MPFAQITGIDLFCGAGGLTRGLLNSGIRISHGFDIDHDCRHPYESNNDSKFIRVDISKTPSSFFSSKFSPGDTYSLIAGCAPCQPFSSYSQSHRRTTGDQRWKMVEKFIEIAYELNPDLIFMENVPQLGQHPIFEKLLTRLNGYCISHEIIDCSDYGIPQKRKRLIVLGSKIGNISIPKSKIPEKTVFSAINHLEPINAGQQSKEDPLHIASKLSEKNLRRIRHSKPGGSWRDWPEDLIADCHKKSSGKTYPSVYGRMEWDKPSPTITTQCFGFGNGRFGHPEQDRAISLREAAILQTFPISYEFIKPGSNIHFSKVGRLIGNAVPVALAEVIGTALLEHVRLHHNA